MDRGAEDVAVLEHDRPEVTADADRDGLAFDLQFRVDADIVLHAARRVQRVVRRGEGRHDLIADRLDDGAVILLGRGTHDLNAGQHHVTRTQVAHDLVDSGAADHIGEQDG